MMRASGQRLTRQPGEDEMTKSQQQDIKTAGQAIALGMPDMAARIISAAIRCAMRSRDAAELRAWAAEKNIDKLPEFIA